MVGITAGANEISYMGSIIIGIISGVVMILSVEFFEQKIKIDDPVGAISVHGLCGTIGTIAVGLFSINDGLFYGGGFGQLGSQLLGVSISIVAALILSFITFSIIKKLIGLRVKEHTEINGLDAMEHGISAYINL